MALEQLIVDLTVTQNSQTVTASGQSFLNDLLPGYIIKKNVSGAPIYTIASVVDNNTFTLTANYQGSSETAEFVIHRSFTPNYHLARPATGDAGMGEILSEQVIDIIDQYLIGTFSSANPKYFTIYGTAGEDIDQFDVVCFDVSTGYLVRAIASSLDRCLAVGIAPYGIKNGDEGFICEGIITNNNWNWNTSDNNKLRLYLSSTQEGKLQDTPPSSGYEVICGIVLGEKKILFQKPSYGLISEV